MKTIKGPEELVAKGSAPNATKHLANLNESSLACTMSSNKSIAAYMEQFVLATQAYFHLVKKRQIFCQKSKFEIVSINKC